MSATIFVISQTDFNSKESADLRKKMVSGLKKRFGDLPVVFSNEGSVSESTAIGETTKGNTIIGAEEVRIKFSVRLFEYTNAEGRKVPHSANGQTTLLEGRHTEQQWKLLIAHADNSNKRAMAPKGQGPKYFSLNVSEGYVIAITGETTDEVVQGRPVKKTPIEKLVFSSDVAFNSNVVVVTESQTEEADDDMDSWSDAMSGLPLAPAPVLSRNGSQPALAAAGQNLDDLPY